MPSRRGVCAHVSKGGRGAESHPPARQIEEIRGPSSKTASVLTKMGPPGRGKGRAPAVYWVSGELEAREALTAPGFLISHGADPVNEVRGVRCGL